MDFYLTQIMSGHGTLNAYVFYMKLVETSRYTKCNRRGQDDDAWYTLFECLAFQQFCQETITTLQEMNEEPPTLNSLTSTMLSRDGGKIDFFDFFIDKAGFIDY